MKLGDRPPGLAYALIGLLSPLSVLLLASGPAPKRNIAKPLLKVAEHHAFYVAGLARRTNNAREASGMGEIAKVWQEFSEKHIEDAISRKLDKELVAVYTDYESD